MNRFVDYTELNSVEDNWLIENHIEKSSITMLSYPTSIIPNNESQHIAADLVCSIATGVPYLGKFKTKKSPVVCLCNFEFQKQIRDWECQQNIKVSPGNITISKRFSSIDKMVNDLIQLDASFELVIINSLTSYFCDGEITRKEIREFIDPIENLISKTETAVLFVEDSSFWIKKYLSEFCTSILKTDEGKKRIISNYMKQQNRMIYL